MSDPPLSNPDLPGVSRLTIDAVTGITGVVESLHHAITSFAGVLDSSDQKRTKGITGMVYRNIRTVTELVGTGIDVLLDRLSSKLEEKESSRGREAVLAALNGVLGDHLVARNNPLAIPMRFRREGQPLDQQTIRETMGQARGIVILMHGLCMNDLQWNRQGHDHGLALANDLGFAPLYFHYNSGLHISENGRNLAQVLEKLFSTHAPGLFFVAHSMGGLVCRSACHYGKLAGHSWLNQLRKIVFLATPHHGAPLEKGGNWADILLEISPYSAPFSRLGKIRSRGITDLRYGNLLDEDWMGRDRFKLSGDQRTPVPLPEGVQCYAIAATKGKEPNKLGDDLIGDGLVTLNSALGRHKKAELNLLFPETHTWVGRDMNHLDLLNHGKVYETIKKWLKSDQ